MGLRSFSTASMSVGDLSSNCGRVQCDPHSWNVVYSSAIDYGIEPFLWFPNEFLVVEESKGEDEDSDEIEDDPLSVTLYTFSDQWDLHLLETLNTSLELYSCHPYFSTFCK